MASENSSVWAFSVYSVNLVVEHAVIYCHVLHINRSKKKKAK